MTLTPEIGIVLGTLLLAMVLFLTELLRMDLVALLVLCVLALTGMVSPTRALEGFGNPAVITIWAMFILSGALTATGVANFIGSKVLKLAGKSETRMIFVIMLTAGCMSAFMNNIGVAALLLPVVMDIAKRSGRPPSRLLIPLAYGTLLGGLTTLLTTPNLLASEALVTQGFEPFRLFDFTPVGVFGFLGGIVFIAFVGRRFLPVTDTSKEQPSGFSNLQEQYALHERMFVMHIPENSINAGKTLQQTRLGSAAGLTVFAVIREDRTELAPDPQTVLAAGDRLLVGGKLDRFHELHGWRELVLEDENCGALSAVQGYGMGEVRLARPSSLDGLTSVQIDFRRGFDANVLAIRRGAMVMRAGVGDIPLCSGDILLVQGNHAALRTLQAGPEFERFEYVSEEKARDLYRLKDWTFTVRVPEGSVLAGATLAGSRLSDAFGMQVLAILRSDTALLRPDPHEALRSGDRLFVKGKRGDLEVLRGLRELEIEREATPYMGMLESERGSLMEAVLSPRSGLPGKSPREIGFRGKFGLQIVTIWREGTPFQSNIRDVPLRFGDALLLLGPPAKFRELARDPDFLVLSETVQKEPRTEKRSLSALIMACVLLPVLLGWLPISISALLGVTLMVLTGCLTMDEAYRSIGWRPIFLISGMLPLGVAMQDSGAAEFLALHMVSMVGWLGPWALIIGFYLITCLAVTVIPSAALLVLIGPIVIKTSQEMGLSPHAVMMAVALAGSASFSSPISHPANLLVMGPGGYRFVDYIKMGLPLTIVVMIIVLLVLPIFWPLYV